MANDGPKDPVTPLAQAFNSQHEIFIQMVASGFTEWQACRILGVMLAEIQRQS